MDQLVSMEMTKSEADELYAGGSDPSSDESPKYPSGLQIYLDEEALAKLGIQELPKVGTDMKLVAEVEICSVSSYESTSGSPDQRVCLQIEAMSLTPMANDPSDAKKNENPAKVLYGASGAVFGLPG